MANKIIESIYDNNGLEKHKIQGSTGNYINTDELVQKGLVGPNLFNRYIPSQSNPSTLKFSTDTNGFLMKVWSGYTDPMGNIKDILFNGSTYTFSYSFRLDELVDLEGTTLSKPYIGSLSLYDYNRINDTIILGGLKSSNYTPATLNDLVGKVQKFTTVFTLPNDYFNDTTDIRLNPYTARTTTGTDGSNPKLYSGTFFDIQINEGDATKLLPRAWEPSFSEYDYQISKLKSAVTALGGTV